MPDDDVAVAVETRAGADDAKPDEEAGGSGPDDVVAREPGGERSA